MACTRQKSQWVPEEMVCAENINIWGLGRKRCLKVYKPKVRAKTIWSSAVSFSSIKILLKIEKIILPSLEHSVTCHEYPSSILYPHITIYFQMYWNVSKSELWENNLNSLDRKDKTTCLMWLFCSLLEKKNWQYWNISIFGRKKKKGSEKFCEFFKIY